MAETPTPMPKEGCPWCQRSDRLTVEHNGTGGEDAPDTDLFYVYCRCWARGPYAPGRANAVAAWDRRAAPAGGAGELGRLRAERDFYRSELHEHWTEHFEENEDDDPEGRANAMIDFLWAQHAADLALAPASPPAGPPEAEPDAMRAALVEGLDNFAVQLADATPDHEGWLAVMRFGLGTLLGDQALLVELIAREAGRQAEKTPPSHRPADHVAGIFRELRLKVVPEEDA